MVNTIAVQQDLYTWFQRCGRDLPWRRTVNPYAILVSEFMLQQTQVATVEAYFYRWMQRFPDLKTLAAAREEEVLEMWQGLGYYARAKNLHKASQALANLSTFPATPEELLCLPGIGEYTAHAIAAFAFDRSVPVVDANIARVLARLGNYLKPVDTSAGVRFLREAAQAFLPPQGGRLHNSALMELGALICKPRQPLCLECPLRPHCQAQTPESLPKKRDRPKIQLLLDHRAFIYDGKSVWLTPASGRWWKGLWVLPQQRIARSVPCDYSQKFSVTRHRVLMKIWKESLEETSGLQKIVVEDLEKIPMPAPHRRGVVAMLALYTA